MQRVSVQRKRKRKSILDMKINLPYYAVMHWSSILLLRLQYDLIQYLRYLMSEKNRRVSITTRSAKPKIESIRPNWFLKLKPNCTQQIEFIYIASSAGIATLFIHMGTESKVKLICDVASVPHLQVPRFGWGVTSCWDTHHFKFLE